MEVHVLAVDDSVIDRRVIESLLKTSSYKGMLVSTYVSVCVSCMHVCVHVWIHDMHACVCVCMYEYILYG